MNIRKVGVVGCGLMGAGIAQVAAQAGYDTIAHELNEELQRHDHRQTLSSESIT